MCAAVFIEQHTQLLHVVCGADKRSCDKINALLDAELDVRLVLVAQIRNGQMYIRNIDALVIGNGTVVEYAAQNILLLRLLYAQFNQTVINQDAGACLHVLIQIWIGDGNFARRAKACARCQANLFALLEENLAVLHVTGTDFRTLGVQQQSNRKIVLLADSLHAVNALLVFLVTAVGKVEACDVHACTRHSAKHFNVVSSRSHCANNLGFSHKYSSQSKYNTGPHRWQSRL